MYDWECRDLADRLFEIIRQHDPSLSLDALGMVMTRTLLELVPASGISHRAIFENYMSHTRSAGEHVMRILDLDNELRQSREPS